MKCNLLSKEEYSFYVNHLKHTILDFWLPRCMDMEYAGYLNCYNNDGTELMSKNKFIWSQGRFVWIFSKLASSKADIFTGEERIKLLTMAKSGIAFLKMHALIPDTMSCTYLTNQKGSPLYFGEEKVYDASIYADCFVILGFAKYAEATEREEEYQFARTLFAAVCKRIETKDYRVLPFVRPEGRKMHGIPMISMNTACELYDTARALGHHEHAEEYRAIIGSLYDEIMDHFRDKNGVIHEIITEDNHLTNDLLGRHLNPGHSLEGLWFLYEGGRIAKKQNVVQECAKTLVATFKRGWDTEYGGITLYADQDGGRPTGQVVYEDKRQDMVQRVLNNWDSKIYWVHSEALYTALLLWKLTKDPQIAEIYDQIKKYTFDVFPNTNREIGEWIQTRMRNGQPDEKMVGLPVKDPFHIPRNLIKIIELF